MSHHTPEPETAAPPSPAAHDAARATPAPAADRAGHVERHGIDVIPASDRHGRPRELFWVWMSANVVYLYFVLGGVLVLLGLSLWEALAITVIGNLWWAAVGWLAVSGPASGTPSVAIMRAMFGVRGNRVFGGGLGVAIGLFYEIINIAVATLAANALLGILGVPLPAGTEWIVLVVVAALSFVLSVYGHATILKLAPVFSAALAVAFVVLAVFVLGAADFSYTPAPMPVADHWAMLLLGYAIVASGPLSWGTGADYARYLPEHTSKRAVAWWTALGGFIPAVLIGSLGVDRRHGDRHDRPAAHDRRDRAGVVHADLPRDRRARQHHEQRARGVLHRPLRAGTRHPGVPRRHGRDHGRHRDGAGRVGSCSSRRASSTR